MVLSLESTYEYYKYTIQDSIKQEKLVNTPVKFIQNPASIRFPAPEVGQHTEEVILDPDCGWDEVGHLKEHELIP